MSAPSSAIPNPDAAAFDEATTRMRSVVMCVDDFGLKPEVNEAVVELADAGVVSATGCMSLGPAWREGAALLRGAPLDVGLHFNLTESFAANGGSGSSAADWLLPQPLWRVMLMAHRRALPEQALQRALQLQLDAFEDAWGGPPDFVDGHQHVHQLPQVRERLLAELERRYGPAGSARRPWLRLTRAPRQGAVSFKQRIIESLGAREFERLARERGFRLNGALLGVYGFDEDAAGYERRLAAWLAQAQEGDVLMMHPAKPTAGSASTGEVIAAARETEYAVLSACGREHLTLAGVRAGRMAADSSILRR